jgi:hypothetical protein
LLLVNGLSDGTLKIYGLYMGLGSWAIQELSGKLELETINYVLILMCNAMW